MLIGISGYVGSGKDLIAKMIQYWMWLNRHPNFAPNKFDPTSKAVYSAGWEVHKFAGKLKQIVSLLTGITVADLEKESVKSSELGKEWWVWEETSSWAANYKKYYSYNTYKETPSFPHCTLIKPTVRMVLQSLGTEWVRDHIGPDSWINALFVDYKSHIEGRSTPKLSGGMGGGNTVGVPVYPNWIISDTRFSNETQAIKDRGGIVIRVKRPVNTGSKIINQMREERIKHSSETSLDTWNFDYVIDNSGTLEDLLEQVRTMLLHFKIIT